MSHNPNTVIPFSNGTEYEIWNKDGQCEGCSRYGKEECRCPLESKLIMGEIPLKLALRMGFDEQGNPPKKLKCWRKYKKKHTDRNTGELL